MSENEAVYDQVSSKGTRYREIVTDDTVLIEYENGAVKDKNTNKWVKPSHVWDSETAIEANNIRHGATRRAVETALVEKARNGGMVGGEGPEAAGFMAGLLADDIISGAGTLRDRANTWQMLVRAADLLPDARQAAAGLPPGVGAQLTISDELAEKIARAKLGKE